MPSRRQKKNTCRRRHASQVGTTNQREQQPRNGAEADRRGNGNGGESSVNPGAEDRPGTSSAGGNGDASTGPPTLALNTVVKNDSIVGSFGTQEQLENIANQHMENEDTPNAGNDEQEGTSTPKEKEDSGTPVGDNIQQTEAPEHENAQDVVAPEQEKAQDVEAPEPIASTSGYLGAGNQRIAEIAAPATPYFRVSTIKSVGNVPPYATFTDDDPAYVSAFRALSGKNPPKSPMPVVRKDGEFPALPSLDFSRLVRSGKHPIVKMAARGGKIAADMPTGAKEKTSVIPSAHSENKAPANKEVERLEQTKENETASTNGKMAAAATTTGSAGKSKRSTATEKMALQPATGSLNAHYVYQHTNINAKPEVGATDPETLSKDECRKPLIAFINQYANSNGKQKEIPDGSNMDKNTPKSVVMVFKSSETSQSSEEANKAAKQAARAEKRKRNKAKASAKKEKARASNSSEIQELQTERDAAEPIKEEQPQKSNSKDSTEKNRAAQPTEKRIESGDSEPIESGPTPQIIRGAQPTQSNKGLLPEPAPDTTVVVVNLNPAMIDTSKSGTQADSPTKSDSTMEGESTEGGTPESPRHLARPSSKTKKLTKANTMMKAAAASCRTSPEPNEEEGEDDDANSSASTVTLEEPISPPHTKVEFKAKPDHLDEYAREAEEIQIMFEQATMAKDEYLRRVAALIVQKDICSQTEVLALFLRDTITIPNIFNYLPRNLVDTQGPQESAKQMIEKNVKLMKKNPKNSDPIKDPPDETTQPTNEDAPEKFETMAENEEDKAEMSNKNGKDIEKAIREPKENDEVPCGEKTKSSKISSHDTEDDDSKNPADITSNSAQEEANDVTVDVQNVEKNLIKPDDEAVETNEINGMTPADTTEAVPCEEASDVPPEDGAEISGKRKKGKPSVEKRRKMKAMMQKSKKKKGKNNPKISPEHDGKTPSTDLGKATPTGRQNAAENATSQSTSSGTSSTANTQPVNTSSNEQSRSKTKENEKESGNTETESKESSEQTPNEATESEQTPSGEIQKDAKVKKTKGKSNPKMDDGSSNDKVGDKPSESEINLDPPTCSTKTDEEAPAPNKTNESKNSFTEASKNDVDLKSKKKKKKQNSKPKNDEDLASKEIREGGNDTPKPEEETKEKANPGHEKVEPDTAPTQSTLRTESVIKTVGCVNGMQSVIENEDTNSTNRLDTVTERSEPVSSNDTNESNPNSGCEIEAVHGTSDIETEAICGSSEDETEPVAGPSGVVAKKKKVCSKKRRKQQQPTEKISLLAGKLPSDNVYFTPIQPSKVPDCNENGNRPTVIVQPMPRRRLLPPIKAVKNRVKRRPGQPLDVRHLPELRLGNLPRMKVLDLPPPKAYIDYVILLLHPYYTCYCNNSYWNMPIPLEPKRVMLTKMGIVLPRVLRLTQDEVAFRAGELAIFKHFDHDKDGVLGIRDFSRLCMALFVNGYSNEHYLDFIHVQLLFNIFDLNGDGMIDKTEFGICYTKWIERILYPTAAIIVVNMQNDFLLPRGTPSISHGLSPERCSKLLNPVVELVTNLNFKRKTYVFNWHPNHHTSFAPPLPSQDVNGKKARAQKLLELKRQREAKFYSEVKGDNEPSPTQRLWPKNCVRGTVGAELHDILKAHVSKKDTLIRNGTSPYFDAFSAFRDVDNENFTSLLYNLQTEKISEVYICGASMDGNTGHTALDTLEFGFPTVLVEDSLIGKDVTAMEKMRYTFWTNHGLFASSRDVKDMVNGVKRRPEIGFKLAVDIYNQVLRTFKENVIYESGDPSINCPSLFKMPKPGPRLDIPQVFPNRNLDPRFKPEINDDGAPGVD